MTVCFLEMRKKKSNDKKQIQYFSVDQGINKKENGWRMQQCTFLVDTSINQKNITLTSARKIQEAQHYYSIIYHLWF